MKKTIFLIVLLGLLLSLVVSWRVVTYARQSTPQFSQSPQSLSVKGTWQAQNQDLLYIVAFSSAQLPNGPLVVYRAAATDLHDAQPVIALARDPLVVTPLMFPSPDGRYLALLTPTTSTTDTLTVLSSDGTRAFSLNTSDVVSNDQLVWSADSQAIYYHRVVQATSPASLPLKETQRSNNVMLVPSSGYEEIHRVDLQGHDQLIMHHVLDSSSLRLIGVDATGALILTLSRPQQAVSVFRIAENAGYGPGQFHPMFVRSTFVMTLPGDILPGNVLRIGADGESLECERVSSWSPLRYQLVHIAFFSGAVSSLTASAYNARTVGSSSSTSTVLARSQSGEVQVSLSVLHTRADLAAQGIPGVPSQEALVVAERNASQQLTLPPGSQVVQALWTARVPVAQWHTVPASILAGLLAFHKRMTNTSGLNANPSQQDEWMLEGHAGLLADAPSFPTMCYGTCPNGSTGHPHVSAAILHGVAFVESNWHQFNTLDYHVQSEQTGTPVESFDGGWGEFQQTWGMPPQCTSMGNCRGDVSKVEYDQSYNIGVGTASLITAWNGTAGVASSSASSDPNDPYKANDWFFAVWAYNGSYGNNPNDVSSSVYGHWYPGAPFRAIYQEYVWYFAAHPQNATSGWTDNYLPSLGSGLLPPQSDFVGTSDSFVACVTCTIPDWTSGSYDRAWVGAGAPNNAVSTSFNATFAQAGGEDIVGLPRDNGGGAAVHRWGNGWTQDFGGGSYLPGAIMLADTTTNAYWVYGGVWTQYLNVDSGATGCHAYPTSALVATSGPGGDSYLRQTFQQGYIVWDATTTSVVQDIC